MLAHDLGWAAAIDQIRSCPFDATSRPIENVSTDRLGRESVQPRPVLMVTTGRSAPHGSRASHLARPFVLHLPHCDSGGIRALPPGSWYRTTLSNVHSVDRLRRGLPVRRTRFVGLYSTNYSRQITWKTATRRPFATPCLTGPRSPASRSLVASFKNRPRGRLVKNVLNAMSQILSVRIGEHLLHSRISTNYFREFSWTGRIS